MKRIALIWAVLSSLLACTPKYELNTEFTVPTELDAPETVLLDVGSSERVVFFWSGGEAADGGLILYEVLFDVAGGNFSNPVASFQSDRGSQSRLTLTHSQLNVIARDGGVGIGQTGSFIWTVKAARGGVVKDCGIFKEITLTRGDGIDAIPESLAIAGSAALEPGQSFRKVENGVFSIVTRVQAGDMYFTSADGRYYIGTTGSLVTGEGSHEFTDVPASGIARITVDFKTLKMKVEALETSVFAQWAATNATFITLEYQGDGVYSGVGEISFYGPGRPGTPSWCSWIEERFLRYQHRRNASALGLQGRRSKRSYHSRRYGRLLLPPRGCQDRLGQPLEDGPRVRPQNREDDCLYQQRRQVHP